MNAALASACRDSYSKWWFMISYEIEEILEYGIHLLQSLVGGFCIKQFVL